MVVVVLVMVLVTEVIVVVVAAVVGAVVVVALVGLVVVDKIHKEVFNCNNHNIFGTFVLASQSRCFFYAIFAVKYLGVSQLFVFLQCVF